MHRIGLATTCARRSMVRHSGQSANFLLPPARQGPLRGEYGAKRDVAGRMRKRRTLGLARCGLARFFGFARSPVGSAQTPSAPANTSASEYAVAVRSSHTVSTATSAHDATRARPSAQPQRSRCQHVRGRLAEAFGATTLAAFRASLLDQPLACIHDVLGPLGSCYLQQDTADVLCGNVRGAVCQRYV